MSQGGSDDKQAAEILTKIIGKKFNDGTEKIKSLYSSAHIYKVPEDLRNLNNCAYVPRLIAIGPFHRKGEHLQKCMQDVKMDYAMQDVKMDYANCLFLRLTKGMVDPDGMKDKLIQECVEKMKKCTVKAKKYYAEELKLKDDEMVEMMLVDGCFILELLYLYYHTNFCQVQDSSSIPQPTNGGESGSKSNGRGCEQPREDPICDSILIANIVRHDLMLLENQIPFFVLEHLFELTVAKIPEDRTTGCPSKLSLERYVRSFFSKFLSLQRGQSRGSKPETSCCLASDHCILSVCGSPKELEQGKTESGKANDYFEYYHILHLIHSSYIPEVEKGQETKRGIQLNSTKELELGKTESGKAYGELTLSASDLHYAGVKFVHSNKLFDVKFINEGIGCWPCRTLEFHIPTIYISKTTESFLRNVIALEQCSPRVPRYFTSYAKIMDMFINSEEDVRVLKKDGVIHNYLSTDKDVRDLFNKLCKEVVLEDFHFDKDCQDASEFNKRRQTRAVRYVTRLFIANPWPALAFFLAIAAFAITVSQFSYVIHTRVRR